MIGKTLQLSRLRAIGWEFWDPIGIRGFGDELRDAAADEYDRYLLRAGSMLAHGDSAEDTAAYLIHIASEHMGLGPSPEREAASRRTVQAIQAYLNEPA